MTHKNKKKTGRYPRFAQHVDVPEMIEARVGKKFEVHLCVGGGNRPNFIVEVFDRWSGQFLYRFTYPAWALNDAKDKMIFLAQVR